MFGLQASRSAVGFRGNPINLNENPITGIDEQDADGNFISPRDLIIDEFNNWGLEAKYLKRYRLLNKNAVFLVCLLYTSPSPRDLSTSRMPSSA